MKNVTIELPHNLAITALESALYQMGNTFCIDSFKSVCADWSITYDKDNNRLMRNGNELSLDNFDYYVDDEETLKQRKQDYKYLSDNLENARIVTQLEKQLEKIKLAQ